MTDQTTSISIDEQIAFIAARAQNAAGRHGEITRAILASLERLKVGNALLDEALAPWLNTVAWTESGDERVYDAETVTQAHHILSGGPMPRETEAGES